MPNWENPKTWKTGDVAGKDVMDTPVKGSEAEVKLEQVKQLIDGILRNCHSLDVIERNSRYGIGLTDNDMYVVETLNQVVRLLSTEPDTTATLQSEGSE